MADLQDPIVAPKVKLRDLIASGAMTVDEAIERYRPATAGESLRGVGRAVARGAASTYAQGMGAAMKGMGKIAPGELGERLSEIGGALVTEMPGIVAEELPPVTRKQGALGRLGQLGGEALGSSIGMGVIAPGTGVPGVIGTGALLGGAQQWADARAHNATDTEQWLAMIGGMALGATEAGVPGVGKIPKIGKLLGGPTAQRRLAELFARADKASSGGWSRLMREGIRTGFSEAFQEQFQQVGSNLLAQSMYDDDRKVLEGVADAGAGAMLNGLLLGALHAHATARPRKGGGASPILPSLPSKGGAPSSATLSDTGAAAGTEQPSPTGQSSTGVRAQAAPASTFPEVHRDSLDPDVLEAVKHHEAGLERFGPRPDLTVRQVPQDDDLSRFARQRGVKVYVVEDPSGKPLALPAAYHEGVALLDGNRPQEAIESFLDHEIGHHVLETVEGAREKYAESIDRLAPKLREMAVREYQEGIAIAMEGQEPEAIQAAQAAVNPDEALTAIVEDFSGIVRLLRKDPAAFSQIEDVGFWRGLIRSVLDAARRILGKPTSAERTLTDRYRSVSRGLTAGVKPEVGLEIAGEVKALLDETYGQSVRPSVVASESAPAVGQAEADEVVVEGGGAREAGAAVSPAMGHRPVELREMLASRLAAEEQQVRERYPQRDETFVRNVAETRRRAREIGNPERERSIDILRRLKLPPVAPSPYTTEEIQTALQTQEAQERAAQTAGKEAYAQGGRRLARIAAENARAATPVVESPGTFAVDRSQVNTPAFRRWFGDSKVVDKDGRPLVVYHGTKGDFTEFDTSKNEGAFFTASKKYAGNYGRPEYGGKVDAYYLSIQNPIDASNRAHVAEWKANRRSTQLGHESMVEYGKRTGRDGAITGLREYVAFSPTQIKSATGNTGAFDPSNPDIRFAVSRPQAQRMTDEELEQVKRKPLPDETTPLLREDAIRDRGVAAVERWARERKEAPADREGYAVWRRTHPVFVGQNVSWDAADVFVRYWQDAFRSVKNWADAARMSGRLTDKNDVYLQEELRRGRTHDQMGKEREAHTKPLFEAIQKSALDLDDIELYWMAKHAPERNAAIKARWEQYNVEHPTAQRNVPVSGSGMTDAQAAAIVQQAEAGPNSAEYQRLHAMALAMNKRTRQLWVEHGLETQERVDALEALYPNFVPLRTDEEVSHVFGERPIPQRTGAGGIRGREFRAALGRTTVADNPLAYMASDLDMAIVRGVRNSGTLRAAYDLAKAVNNPDFATVDKVAMKDDIRDGRIVRVPDREAQRNEVDLKIDGEIHRITFEQANYQIAEALKNTGAANSDAYLEMLGKITRPLAGLSTRWNPFFPPINLPRDILGAGLNITVEHGANAAFEITNPAAITSSIKEYHAKGAMYQRYKDAGAPVSFLDLDTIEVRLKKLQNQIAEHKDPNAPWHVTKRTFRRVGEVFGTWSDLLENATRFSAFKWGVAHGMSDARAASFAKNLTTNFERHGAGWGANLLRSLFAFSTASIQTIARVGPVLRKPGARKLLLGMVLGAAALDWMNRIFGGTDDDGIPYYDKIPEWRKRSHMIVMGPDGTYAELPLPFVWGFFHVLGTGMGGAANGDVAKSIGMIGNSLAETMNPLGGGSDIGESLTPTFLKPIVQIQRGKDWSGRPIYPAEYDRITPDSELYYDGSTNPTLVAIARYLNSATGGDIAKEGILDISPITIEYLARGYLGGVGADSMRLESIAERVARGEGVGVSDIPLARRYVGSVGLREQKDVFREHLDLVDAVAKRVKAGGDRDDALYPLRLKARRWREDVRELESAIRANPDRRKELQEQLRNVMIDAVRTVREARQ